LAPEFPVRPQRVFPPEQPPVQARLARPQPGGPQLNLGPRLPLEGRLPRQLHLPAEHRRVRVRQQQGLVLRHPPRERQGAAGSPPAREERGKARPGETGSERSGTREERGTRARPEETEPPSGGAELQREPSRTTRESPSEAASPSEKTREGGTQTRPHRKPERPESASPPPGPEESE
jgi:hypothetical protein